ncbi:PREDICTED: sodium/potassium/calcium exchanger 6, mitochondrial-like, partial [Dipodomys ordii]|uniref:Sodium/potassium/calcium exchanger 6, mitochondrial-like n=1 Tax=Dipodomys ordii TaxID=10020 RepID=A0A1S3GV85_DIPOR
LFAFLGFLTSALWINAAATEVVNVLRSLGVVFRLSNTVLGLTLLAWGNSIGDAFSDFTLARQGYPRMAFSACFGGINFNILVGVGLGCLLQIARGHTEVKVSARCGQSLPRASLHSRGNSNHHLQCAGRDPRHSAFTPHSHPHQ